MTNDQMTAYHTLLADAQALESCANPADGLCYSRYADTVADAMRARDVALLRAEAEQSQLDTDSADLAYYTQHQPACVMTQVRAMQLQRRAARAAWRRYQEAEMALLDAQSAD